ncbi:hypothetical protein E2C01_010240 [Portunus trituberculatus]|uniref:Uncharacterized protein n=1 Tax=Portunus trituberculatus TaxID=210409 RepID=A0A5B7D857_PORTR|nr:hypothetical protein [Portunus trituberculatus]
MAFKEYISLLCACIGLPSTVGLSTTQPSVNARAGGDQSFSRHRMDMTNPSGINRSQNANF